MNRYEVTPGQRAAWAVQVVIERNAAEAFGAAVTGSPSPLGPVGSPVGGVPAVAGLRAAGHARAVAGSRVRYYAGAARGEGRSWREIGEALGLTAAAEEHGRAVGELAFELVTEGREPGMTPAAGCWPGQVPSVRWRCSSCGERVTDRGPYESAPYSNEQGHAGSCGRHCHDVACYREGDPR